MNRFVRWPGRAWRLVVFGSFVVLPATLILTVRQRDALANLSFGLASTTGPRAQTDSSRSKNDR